MGGGGQVLIVDEDEITMSEEIVSRGGGEVGVLRTSIQVTVNFGQRDG